MLQRSANPTRQRPLYQDVQQLSDAQLSIMCQTHRIFPGPITSRNRRQAERQLHVALIAERAKFRAQQQFALECRLRFSGNANAQPIPPPQQHYDFRAAVPEPVTLPRNYWPQPRALNWRSNPPSSSSFRYRQVAQDPVLEPRRYVTWQQQNRSHQQAAAAPYAEDTDTNILGFKLPFSLETAREITTKIGETLKRFQGGGEDQEAAGFQGGFLEHGQGKYQERYQDEQQEEQQNSFQDNYKDGRCLDASDDEYREDESQGEYQEYSDEDLSYPYSEEPDRDTLSDPSEDEKSQQANVQSVSYDFQKLRALADAQSRSELGPNSSATTYYECYCPVPLKRAASNFCWWWPRRATAGDERIPKTEQTHERNLHHEHELKTIDYLSEAPPRVEDGMLELMSRVELREDSEEEDLVVLPDGSLSTQPAPRTYAGFCRYIFRLLCCDRQGKLDAEKLRCTFVSCCMAFGIYVGFKMMR